MGEDDEKAIKLECRIYALEVMVCTILAAFVVASPTDPQYLYAMIRDRFLDGARRMTLPGFDAVMSDMLAGEIEIAADELLLLASGQINRLQQHLQK